MTQVFIDRHLADTQLSGNFAVKHPLVEAHFHHSSVLYGQRLIYQLVQPRQILRVGLFVIFNLVKIESVEIAEPLA